MEDFLLRAFCWSAPFQQVLLVEDSGHLNANCGVFHPLGPAGIAVLGGEQGVCVVPSLPLCSNSGLCA